MAGEGGVASEARAAHGGRRGGDLHRGRVRLLLYPGDQVERLLVVIWTVVIGRYLRVEKRMLVMRHVMVAREELGPGCDW